MLATCSRDVLIYFKQKERRKNLLQSARIVILSARSHEGKKNNKNRLYTQEDKMQQSKRLQIYTTEGKYFNCRT